MSDNTLTPANLLPILGAGVALEFMNAHYAVVLEGGRARVLIEEYDEVLNRFVIDRSGIKDLTTFYANIRVELGTDANNNPRHEPLVKYWHLHPMRRTFQGTVFLPGGDRAG